MDPVILAVKSKDFPIIEGLTQWHFQSFEDRSFGEMTADQLRRDIMAAKRQCWIAWNGEVLAVALTQVCDNDLETVEMTHCAGKDRDAWQEDIVQVIRDWAINRGAKRFRIVCRPGWVKMLKKMGLHETHRILEQEI